MTKKSVTVAFCVMFLVAFVAAIQILSPPVFAQATVACGSNCSKTCYDVNQGNCSIVAAGAPCPSSCYCEPFSLICTKDQSSDSTGPGGILP